MAMKGKWLAFGLATAALGGLAAYLHRKEIEKTLQEISDQMDAWDEGFQVEDIIVHPTDAPAAEEAPAPMAEEEPAESDFADAPTEETPEA